jgi:hypothetical protein
MKHSTSHLTLLAAVIWRRCHFRVEAGRPSPEEPFLEFENGLRVQSLDVSSEIDETLPLAEAPGEAAQSASKAGPLAHERATVHAVAGALQARGSATAGNLAGRIPGGSPCDNEQKERSDDPAHRLSLVLLTRPTSLESWFLSSAAGNEGTSRPHAFVTTRWSLILSGADSKSAEKNTRAALAELCRIYWRPIFAFVSQSGYSAEDAEDLKGFLVMMEGDWLQNAHRGCGRFAGSATRASARVGCGFSTLRALTSPRSGKMSHVRIWPRRSKLPKVR